MVNWVRSMLLCTKRKHCFSQGLFLSFVFTILTSYFFTFFLLETVNLNIKKSMNKTKRLIANAKKIGRTQKIVEKFERTYTVNNIETLFFSPCIYFLKHNFQIVYIGETTSIMSRISQHINENEKIFTSFSFEKFKGSDLERKHEESILINKHKPFYNKTHIK